MSLPSKINKENFRLLDLSTDQESDLQLEIIPNRKKKITRRDRAKHTNFRGPEPNLGTEVRCALQWAFRGTLVLWLLMLTWICANLYDQVSLIRADVAKVSTSSNSVGDSLQDCHTAAKELRSNVTDLSARLTKLELDYQELTVRLDLAAGMAAKVNDQLSAAPKLGDMPRHLSELEMSAANLGSKINGFAEELNSAKKQVSNAVATVEEMKTMVQVIEGRTNETIANVTNNVKRDEEIKEQIASLNTTLGAKVDALQIRIAEISKPQSTAAPTTTTSTTTASTSTSTTAIPVPQSKPAVLQ